MELHPGGVKLKHLCEHAIFNCVCINSYACQLSFVDWIDLVLNNSYEPVLFVALAPVWKVARYTSSAPPYLRECDGYVDGGLICNNPSECGLTEIQSYYHHLGLTSQIALVMSIGTGIMPPKEMGSTDIQEYFSIGKEWLNPIDFVMKFKNLLSMLGHAVSCPHI